MERHAVPQNIMEVEFKLFGALTVKQFGYAAAGFIVAFLLFLSSWPFLLKFLLMLISVGGGLFLALIRINGQQSSVWLKNFIIAMLTSQQRVWQKSTSVPDVLQPEQALPTHESIEKVRKAGKVKASMSSIPKFSFDKQVNTEVDDHEEKRLAQIGTDITNTFDGKTVQQKVIPGTIQEQEFKTTNSVEKPIFISGMVVTKAGKPVNNALININKPSGEFVGEGLSDVRGVFKLDTQVKKGEYIVSISSPNLLFDYFKIKVREDKPTTFKFISKN